MPEGAGVFISHHHSPEEDAFTARLKADLRAAGADVWVEMTKSPSTTSLSGSMRVLPDESGSSWS
jgi:hypothetical protein